MTKTSTLAPQQAMADQSDIRMLAEYSVFNVAGVSSDYTKYYFAMHRAEVDPVGFVAAVDAHPGIQAEALGYRPAKPGQIVFGDDSPQSKASPIRIVEAEHLHASKKSATYRRLVKQASPNGVFAGLSRGTPIAGSITDSQQRGVICFNPDQLGSPLNARYSLVFELGNLTAAGDLSDIRLLAANGAFEKPTEAHDVPTAKLKTNASKDANDQGFDLLLARRKNDGAALTYAKKIEAVEHRSDAIAHKAYASIMDLNPVQRLQRSAKLLLTSRPNGLPRRPTEKQAYATQVIWGHTGPYLDTYDNIRGVPGASIRERTLRGLPTLTAAERQVLSQQTTAIYADTTSTPGELRTALQADARSAIAMDPRA